MSERQRRRRKRVRAVVSKVGYTNPQLLLSGQRVPFFKVDTSQADAAQQAEAVVLSLVTEIEDRARTQHGCGPTFSIDVKFDWTTFRKNSWGGTYHAGWRSRLNNYQLPCGPGINMAMPAPYDGISTFKEYAHMDAWCETGPLANLSYHDYLRVLTLHESSHAIQQHLWPRLTGHGVQFMFVYSRLRVAYGYVDASRPSWLSLTPEAQERAVKWRRLPSDPVLAATDPEAYRKKARRLQQQRRRALKRNRTENAK